MSGGLIPFKTKGPKKDSSDGKIVDHGTLGDLSYEVYERNVIHIFDKDCMFHKDIVLFENEISKIDFNKMVEGETFSIKGSGDTDILLFKLEDGEIKIELTKRGFDAIEKLKSILKKNK